MKQMQDWLHRELHVREIVFVAGIAVFGFVSGGWLLLQREPPALETRKEQVWSREAADLVTIRGAVPAERVPALRNPFSPAHEVDGRQELSRRETLAVQEKTALYGSGAGEHTSNGTVNLNGILLSDTGDGMAVLTAAGTQFSLRPGEEKHGIYLVSVQSTGVVIKSAGGERTLTIRQ